MKADTGTNLRLRALAACCVLTFVWSTSAAEPVVIEMDLPSPGTAETAASYIVQAIDVNAAARAVESVGGTVTRVTGMNHAVRATLLPTQVELLRRRSDVRSVREAVNETASSNPTRETNVRSLSPRLA